MTSTAGNTTTTPERRRPSRFLLALAGLIGTLAITVPMRWNSAFFVLSGTILPVILAELLARGSRHRLRFPGLVAVSLTLAGVFVLCWFAKYPNPDKAFTRAMGMPVPGSMQGLSAECGWFDGQITVLRFTADPELIRGIAGGARHRARASAAYTLPAPPAMLELQNGCIRRRRQERALAGHVPPPRLLAQPHQAVGPDGGGFSNPAAIAAPSAVAHTQ